MNAQNLRGDEEHVTAQRVGRFVAADAFAIAKPAGDHAIGTVGLTFQKHFYPVLEQGQVSEPLDTWTLGHAADDRTLIAMIGGEDTIAVPLSAVHRLIALGSRGDNHMDGRSNFAYARSPVDGRLWAIHWIMNTSGEWIVGAVTVPHPDLDWPAGARLFVPRNIDDRARQQRCSAQALRVCIARP